MINLNVSFSELEDKMNNIPVNAKKQLEVLQYFKDHEVKTITLQDLLAATNVSDASVKALIAKEILSENIKRFIVTPIKTVNSRKQMLFY